MVRITRSSIVVGRGSFPHPHESAEKHSRSNRQADYGIQLCSSAGTDVNHQQQSSPPDSQGGHPPQSPL
jgi:hypothetical protein